MVRHRAAKRLYPLQSAVWRLKSSSLLPLSLPPPASTPPSPSPSLASGLVQDQNLGPPDNCPLPGPGTLDNSSSSLVVPISCAPPSPSVSFSLLQLTRPCALHLYGWPCLTFAKTWNPTFSTLTATAGKYQSHNLFVFLPIRSLPGRKSPRQASISTKNSISSNFRTTPRPPTIDPNFAWFWLRPYTSPHINLCQNAILDCRTSANRIKPPGEDKTTC
ncbi:hypothetical protein BZA77DRAFT_41602 [Pyronema omphalodes]|nr:hypothetical protein BZA77DRAFT_41602 [Pyronema omphalodes]